MSQTPYNNQDLKNYLLSALPEDEIERFDELSFTDDEFSDALNAIEKDLIDAYVQGELSGETLKKFKSHYLSSPLRSEKVKFAQTFQTFAEKNLLVSSETIASESKPNPTNGFFAGLNIFANRRLFLQWSLAAFALIFLTVGGYLIVNNFQNRKDLQLANQSNPTPANQPSMPLETNISKNINAKKEVAQSNQPETNATAPPIEKESNSKPKSISEPSKTPAPIKTPTKTSIAAFLLTPTMRSSNRLSNLSVTQETTAVAMRLQLESDDYPRYRIILTDESNNIIWRSGNLKAKGGADSKMLNVSFPAKLLKSKIYSLQVSGVAADNAPEIISDYPFKIVRQ